MASEGSDNALFRLGEDMSVRLPKAHWSTHLLKREHLILPQIAARLPLAVPQLIAAGLPGETYEHAWSVMNWIEGAPAPRAAFDTVASAEALAGFLHALQRLTPDARITAGADNHFRGAALETRNALVEQSLAALSDELDRHAAMKVWSAALAAPGMSQPRWLHGDLHAGNLLLKSGTLGAVIDWGLAGIGDTAIDLTPALFLFTGAARHAFIDAMQADDAAWTRARGWLLSVSLIALAYHRGKNAAIAAGSRAALKEVLSDT